MQGHEEAFNWALLIVVTVFPMMVAFFIRLILKDDEANRKPRKNERRF